MNQQRFQWRRLIIIVSLACPLLLFAQQQAAAPALDGSGLTTEQIKNFLLTARVIKSKDAPKGITHPGRLTLTDGAVTHDASFQAVDEHEAIRKFENGRNEINFVDSYKYNIAAYELAEMIGLEDLMPVYVERKWQGQTGSLSWWLPVKMDEGERLKRKIDVPDTAADTWNNRMHRIRVFDALVYDSDPNLTNVLIDEDWRPWRVDFTRAFRLMKDLPDPKGLVRCDRQLLEKLKSLNADEVATKTKLYLTKGEVKALMARRDKIVTRFEKLIAEKGEKEVLY